MTDLLKPTVEAAKKQTHERLEIIRSGDINAALRSMVDAEKAYCLMRESFKLWASIMREYERERRALKPLLEDFNRNAQRVMGDSIRHILAECKESIRDEDVNDVTDDGKWTSLLAAIGGADTARSLKMTKIAYKIAVDSIASYKSKIFGLERKTPENGASENECAVASRKIQSLNIALEVIQKRKDVLVELNLKLRAAMHKFASNNAIDPKADRDPTDKELKILKGAM